MIINPNAQVSFEESYKVVRKELEEKLCEKIHPLVNGKCQKVFFLDNGVIILRYYGIIDSVGKSNDVKIESIDNFNLKIENEDGESCIIFDVNLAGLFLKYKQIVDIWLEDKSREKLASVLKTVAKEI